MMPLFNIYYLLRYGIFIIIYYLLLLCFVVVVDIVIIIIIIIIISNIIIININVRYISSECHFTEQQLHNKYHKQKYN